MHELSTSFHWKCTSDAMLAYPCKPMIITRLTSFPSYLFEVSSSTLYVQIYTSNFGLNIKAKKGSSQQKAVWKCWERCVFRAVHIDHNDYLAHYYHARQAAECRQVTTDHPSVTCQILNILFKWRHVSTVLAGERGNAAGAASAGATAGSRAVAPPAGAAAECQ